MSDKETRESGLQRYTGIKKYGKKGFERLQKAGRDGASEEEKGKIKDQILGKKKTNEGLADMADMVERDHEVQMARAELYKIAKYSIKLHDMLKNVSEAEGLEGWVQAKITKASDYIGSVFHNLEYDMKFGGDGGKAGPAAPMTAESKAKPDYIDLDKDGNKKEPMKKAAKDAKKTNEEITTYKSSLHTRLAEKAVSKAQQQAAGIALAAKRKGKTPAGKGAAAQMAKMSTKELEKYAGTKHKGLPAKKD